MAIDTRTGVSRGAGNRWGARAAGVTRRFAIASDEDSMITDKGEAPASVPSWFAVWTRSHCEERVTDDLTMRGFETFLPKAQTWVQQRGRRRRVCAPLFPGYLFVRHAMDPRSHAEVLRAQGVVRLLGDSVGPTAIGASEIEAVRRLADSGLPMSRRGPLEHGHRVRVVAGPLAGLEGRFLRSRAQKGLFVIAVTLLRRAVAVEVEAALVEAV
jgi:transcription antitermination factor NusG